MDFINNLLLIPLFTGPIFIITGFILYKFPPKKINALYGYRTANSMKDQLHWDFAQQFSAKEMMIGGFLLSLTSFFGLFLEFPEFIEVIVGFVLMFLFITILFTRTEKALKTHFSKDHV